MRGARLAVRAGFDALELHLGHGYLLSSFLSPLHQPPHATPAAAAWPTARRSRAQVVRAVRDEVGDEVAVYAKLGMTDGVRGGLQVEEALDVASMLEADGCLDALQLTAGSSLLNPMYLFRGGVPLRSSPRRCRARSAGGCAPSAAASSRSTPTRSSSCCRTPAGSASALDLPLMLLGGISTRATLDRAMAEGFASSRWGGPCCASPTWSTGCGPRA